MNSQLISIQVGQPQTYSDDQGIWESAFFKEAVSGPIFLGSIGLEGDAVVDIKHHGGTDQAVLLYSAAHYTQWQTELGFDFPFGAFAENLTVSGIDESSVRIGDILKIGSVCLEVTQPRIPCWKIARRWKMPDLTRRVTQTSRTGFYGRVLQDGYIEAGQSIELFFHSETGQTVKQAFQEYLSSKRNQN